MVIFHSYVKLPEGKREILPWKMTHPCDPYGGVNSELEGDGVLVQNLLGVLIASLMEPSLETLEVF